MRKNFFIMTLIFILIISLFSVTVVAADTQSFTVSMTANNSRVSAGSEVLITVKVSNLSVGENGINKFTAYLSYDTDVFETLTDSSIDGMDGWVPSYSTGTGKITLMRKTFLKNDAEIMQISLKTKSDVAEGTQGEVKLSTIIVSNSSDEVTTSPVSTNITVGNGSGGDVLSPTSTNTTPIVISPSINTVPTVPVNNSVSENNITPITNTNQSINQNQNVNNNNSNKVQVVNEADSDMPYTGTDSNALARIIIGVIFIGLVMYIKIEKMNKDIR